MTEEQKAPTQEPTSNSPSKECSFNLTEDDIKQDASHAKLVTENLEQQQKEYKSGEIVQVIGSPHLKGVRNDNFIQIDDPPKNDNKNQDHEKQSQNDHF